MTTQPFIWGRGGKAMSYEELQEQKKLEERLAAQGVDTSPVQHWTQGAARVAQAIAGAFRRGNLEKAQLANADTNKAMIASLLGGGGGSSSAALPETPSSTTPAAPSFAGGGSSRKMAMPTGAEFDEIGSRLQSDLTKDLGLSAEQAAGVVGNLAHESGGFGSLQEIKPLVPGSRGGFGYAQWTGPRRKAFEEWSAANKLDPTSYEANYGFLKHELTNTPEGKVLDALRKAPDAATATEIFSSQFLRPGIPGMGSRHKWTERALSLPGQVASADPSFLPQLEQPTSAPAPIQTVAQAMPQTAQAQAAPVQRVAQAVQGIDPQVLDALTNPAASPATREVAKAIMQQRVQAAQQEAQRAWDLQKMNQERAWKLQDEATRQDFERKKPVTVGDALIDPVTRQPIYKAPQKPMAVGPEQDVINPETGEIIRGGKQKPETLSPGQVMVSPDGKEIFRAPANPQTVAPGASLVDATGKPLFTAPDKDKTTQTATELRKEILGLPSYKSYTAALPAWKSMVDAAQRDDKAADLNMVYALAKIMDPTSVVREGEIQMANDTQGYADKLNGFIKSIQGEGRLAPAARQGLLQEAQSRMQAFNEAFGADMEFYRGIVGRGGINELDVIPSFGEMPKFDPSKISTVKRDGGENGAPTKTAKPLTPELKAEIDAAIKAGKPREMLRQRLIQNGYDASGF